MVCVIQMAAVPVSLIPMLPNKVHTVITLATARKYIDQLDLGYIVEQMCAISYPLPRWVRIEAEHCCALYKNFLWLQKKFPSEKLVPTREIDEFWHNHILHTQHYIKDCQHIFGHYFHHQPAGPDHSVEKLAQGFLRTKALYLAEFKEPLLLIAKS